jgi:hypothetical protein
MGLLSTPKKTGKKDMNGNPKIPKEYRKGIAILLKKPFLTIRIS